MKPFTNHKQQRDTSTSFFHSKKFLFGVISTISAWIAATAITNEGANAATAYLFSTPTDYGSFERSLEGTWGTNKISTAVWGQFDINDTNNTATSEVGIAGASTGVARIYFMGDPYAINSNTGTATDSCNKTDSASNCRYGSTITSLSSPGFYDRWYYDSTNNLLYFYSSSGVASGSQSTGSSPNNTDSIQLSLNTPNNIGLFNFDGWNSVNTISWCSNNLQASGGSGCTNPKAWTFSTANALAYIRVPSPGLALGLLPFLALVAKRRSAIRISLCTKPLNTTTKLHT